MKLGFSSFSFKEKLVSGAMGIGDVVEWIASVGGEHIELASVTFSPPGAESAYELGEQDALLAELQAASQRAGIVVSGICIPANFLDPATRAAQVERVKRHVDLCAQLGVRYLRHDVTEWSRRAADIADLEEHFPALVAASAEIAAYAASKYIVTSIENHGFFMNSSERVRRLIHHVAMPNFKTTLDVGNFLCVDEDPLIASELNLPETAFVHLKDFYVRSRYRPQGAGWLVTPGRNYLLGSVIGFGDMDIGGILAAILASGYDGFVSIEFEGNEDCLFGCERGLINTREMIAALQAG